MKHRFTPFWGYNGDRHKAEREFQISLSNLCRHYDLPVPECVSVTFPQNIYQSWQAVSEMLQVKDKRLQCIIAGDETHTATLATLSRYNTGTTLFYIPVRPLWHWVRNSEAQKLADLLLAVCAYLHQVVQIPFFTETGSYVGEQYQMIEDWVNDDQEDEKYRQEQLDELYTMHNAGLKLHEQIRKPEYVRRLEEIVLNFNPADDWELDWHTIAMDFLQLYRQYPERSVFDHIHPNLLYDENEDRICADQYISFYWSGNDGFEDTFFEAINCHFQEIAHIDEPMHLQLFDHIPEKVLSDFDFETRLFALLNRFCQRLNDHDDEKHEPTIQ